MCWLRLCCKTSNIHKLRYPRISQYPKPRHKIAMSKIFSRVRCPDLPQDRDVQSPRESGTRKSINIEISEPTHAPKLKTPRTSEISTHKKTIGSRIKNCTDQAHLGNACLTVFRRSPVDGAAHDVMPFRTGLPPASCPSAVHHKCSASSSELAHHLRDFCHLRPVCFRFVAMARHLQRASQPARQPGQPGQPTSQAASQPGQPGQSGSQPAG